MASLRLTCVELDAELLPEHAVFLHASRALVIAHLHAPAEASSGFGEEPLVRLSRAAMRMQAKVIFLLGELTRSDSAIEEEQLLRFAEFRERCSLPIRHIQASGTKQARAAPAEWCIDRVPDSFEVSGVRFGSDASGGGWCVSGAVRGAVTVTVANRTWDAPAFVVNHAARTLVLPSFSKFARGTAIAHSEQLKRYAIHSNCVNLVEDATT